MKTLRELYKVCKGSSSSHTMGPERACAYFKEQNTIQEKNKIIN